MCVCVCARVSECGNVPVCKHSCFCVKCRVTPAQTVHIRTRTLIDLAGPLRSCAAETTSGLFTEADFEKGEGVKIGGGGGKDGRWA